MNENGSTQRIWTISNIITISRILLVPVFVAALLAPWPEWLGVNGMFSEDAKRYVAAGLFILISCTDWLDGYLARSRNEVTDFGKFMDPLADKILVAAALIALVELGALPTWVVLVILAREFIVSGVRMMAATKGVVIAASMIGKFKTVFQMIAIVLFTVKDSHMIGSFSVALSDTLWVVSWLVMLVAVGLTIASLIDYLVKASDILGFGQSNQQVADKAIDNADERQSVQGEAGLQASRVVEIGTRRGYSVATAESLTGGLVGATITDVPGASNVFRGGVVSYVNDVKRGSLDVSEDILQTQGAVCEDVAVQMADGARRAMGSDFAVSVTGIAGPGGAEPGKPVGTVWMGLSTPRGTSAREFHFQGTREDVREKTVLEALRALADSMENDE